MQMRENAYRAIEAGANAITYTPPTTGELFVPIMREHRKNFAAEKL